MKIYLKSSPDNTQDAAETDPFYSSVSALFYFDGTDLSTTFVEEKGNAVTTYGTALLSTANKVMGTAGGQFYGSHDYISIPHNAALEFGSGDFTVEGRVFFDSTGTYVAIYSKYDSSSNIAFTIYKSGSAVVVYASSNGTTWNLLNAVSIIGSISINTWYAIAVTREGNVWKTYVNGTLVSNVTVAGTIFANTSAVYLGKNPLNVVGAVPSRLDEWRVTKGVARYSGNYTVRTDPFPNA